MGSNVPFMATPKPRILDLFCGAGGAGMGYQNAGFDVVGVDIEDHVYPAGYFVKYDAMAMLDNVDYLRTFDVIHASPPCQGYTTMSAKHPTAQAEWPQLIAPVREKLRAWGGTYVIENVVGAKRDMVSPVKLSGGMFGLGVDRPRLFESNAPLTAPRHVKPSTVVGVYGRHHDGRRLWTRADGSILRAARTLEEGQRAMGIDWMNWHDLTEAIPPAYTEYLGRQLIAQIQEVAA
jgi:DNA (cytosine-5)-methyltransferase 1